MDRFKLQKLRDLPIEGVAERLGLQVNRHKALCPFHDDHHASLSFSIRRNSYRCFACGASGGTIDLAMRLLNQPFVEVCRPFSLRVGRFMKEGSYLPSGILGEKAVMICLSELVALKHGDGDFTRIMKEGIGTQAPAKTLVKQEAPIDKHRTAPGEAVVDLHIGELVDNILGMSSHDMLKIQTDYFKKMLDSAIAADYNKVTFIHGVGNGVLKNAIIEALKDYHNTENRMASIAKFGVGAIDVIITEKNK